MKYRKISNLLYDVREDTIQMYFGWWF